MQQRKLKSSAVSKLRNLVITNIDFGEAYLNSSKFSTDALNTTFFEDCEFGELPKDFGLKLVESYTRNYSETQGMTRDQFADFQCGKYLYETLNGLTPVQASDPGFWTYLHHFDGYEYVHLRWPNIKKLSNDDRTNYIINHWIQTSSSQNSSMSYPLSALWWSFYQSIDENEADPYRYTKILFSNYTLRVTLLGSSQVFGHKEAVLGTLKFIEENNLHERSLDEAGRAIVPFLNLMGGTKPLSYFDRYWFCDQLNLKFKSDIEDYGRLFRRDEKKGTLVLKAVHKDVKNRPFRYLNLNKNGSYTINETDYVVSDYNVEIFKADKDKYLLQCYESGHVNKVSIASLMSKKLNKIYNNGLFSGGELSLLKIVDDIDLIGIQLVSHGVQSVKLHSIGQISLHGQMSSQGNKLVYNDSFEKLRYFILSATISNKLERLIFNSFIAKGKDINKAYYKTEKEVLTNYFGHGSQW